VSAGRGHGTDTARADTNGGGRHRQLSLGRRLAMGVFTAEDDTTLNKYDFPRDKAPVPADSGRPSSSEADDLASGGASSVAHIVVLRQCPLLTHTARVKTKA
jgi:hypothetical protein